MEEALAGVLPHPAWVPSTLGEETTIACLVQKKIADWMSYGKVPRDLRTLALVFVSWLMCGLWSSSRLQGRDDVEAVLRASMFDKHERWAEVERNEMAHLLTSLPQPHAVGAAY